MSAKSFAKAPVRLLSTLVLFASLSAGCGTEGSTTSIGVTSRGGGTYCPDCPDLEPLITIYENGGTFDVFIDEFANFDSTGVTDVRIEFERNSQTESYTPSFTPDDVEWGIDETSLQLPGSLDYTVDSGLSATLVFEDPSTQVEVLVDAEIVDGE